MINVRKPFLIVVSDLRPVIAVHVRRVKPVTVLPPNFVKDLVPFLSRDYFSDESSGRDIFSRTLAGRICVEYCIGSLQDCHQLVSVGGCRKTTCTGCESRLFSIFYGKDPNRRLSIGLPTIVKRRLNGINEVSFRDCQAAVVV